MKSAILPLLCFLFVSCFQEKTELIIHKDLSTVITSEIKVPNAVLKKVNSQSPDSYFSNRTILENGILVPKNISKAELTESLPEGATLKLHSAKTNIKDTTVLFRIECRSKTASESIFENRMRFDQTNDYIELNFCAVDISPDQDKPDDDGFDPKKEYAGYVSVITITAPEQIEKHNCGTLSPDKRTLTYSYSVLKGAEIPNGIIKLSWKKK